MRVLLLRLEAPLQSFGGVAIDNYGVIDEFPAASLLTGLLGNALGYRRAEVHRLQRLQDRLRYAVRVDRPGLRIRDFQTAQLSQDDKAWTTRGVVQERAGGPDTYRSPHLRYRDYHADAAITVALTLDEADERPSVDEVAGALDHPARPLFLGRKPCLPSSRLLLGIEDSASLQASLIRAPLADDASDSPRCFVPHAGQDGAGVLRKAGRRNWRSDVHQGQETWRETTWTTLQQAL